MESRGGGSNECMWVVYMLSPLHGENEASCLIGAWVLAPLKFLRKHCPPQAAQSDFVGFGCSRSLIKNTGMRRASYFRHNILEQRREVTTGENLHEIALGTDEVSDHLSAQIHKYISTHQHQSHILFLYPATILFTGP